MTPKLIIRKGNKSEAAQILAMQQRAFQSEAELYHDPAISPLTQTLEELEAEFEKKIFLTAWLEDLLVGSVRAHLDHGTCHISRLVVEPSFQGQGIGTALMKTAEQLFPAARRCELFTGQRSLRNLRFYERLRYKPFRTQKVSDRVTFVYLERRRRKK